MADEPTRDKALARELGTVPFGPAFFLGQLRAFARDRCPDPAESLPAVELHLVSGEVLDLCHVMGLAPAFMAVAVYDGPRSGGREARMRTELLPYAHITRVTIRPVHEAGAHVGFDLHREPEVLETAASAEEALMRAAAVTTGPGEGTDPGHG